MFFEAKGVIPALITPLDEKGNVSEKATRKLIDFVIDGGVHGVFVIGTTGEFYGLTYEEKRRLMEITVDQVKGRVPVYAGTGGITTRECIELTKIAEDCKVDAVSVLTPMFITPNQNELYEHYKAIAASTSLPVIFVQQPAENGRYHHGGDGRQTGGYREHRFHQRFHRRFDAHGRIHPSDKG